MKRILKISLASILVVVLIASLYIRYTLPPLPEDANRIINEVISSDIPPLRGQQAFAQNGPTRIWYEAMEPADSIRGTMLLIMGISNDALAWPRFFLQPLVDQGYRVIRFDSRGTGLSDWMEDWTQQNAYSLEDMAGDAVAILDDLSISQAHIIGVSLGGMIAQTMAIRFPERVTTLTSMMSSGHIMDENLPSINLAVIKDLMLAQARYGIVKSEANQVKLHIAARQLLRGSLKYEPDVEEIAQSVLYNLRKRNGFNSQVFKQHSAATMKSGSRYEQLKQLKIPTLVVHGGSDPLINFQHGKKCAELIPGAKSLWIDEMGHDIPQVFVDRITTAIFNHIELYEKDSTRYRGQ